MQLTFPFELLLLSLLECNDFFFQICDGLPLGIQPKQVQMGQPVVDFLRLFFDSKDPQIAFLCGFDVVLYKVRGEQKIVF